MNAQRTRWLLLMLAGCASAPTGTEPRDELRGALCPTGGFCEVESALEVGSGPSGARLSVVRIRLGELVCTEGQRAYQDWLVASGAEGIRPLRELAFGDGSCLEWEHSEWTLEDGELVFHFGMMGAPAGPETDTRRHHVRFQPWPLEVRGARRGEEATSSDWVSIPEDGPIFVLSMDEEDFRSRRREAPEATTPSGWTR